MFDNKSVLEDDDTLTKRPDPEDSAMVSPLDGEHENEATRPFVVAPGAEREPARD